MDAPIQTPPIKIQTVTISPIISPEAVAGNRLSLIVAVKANIQGSQFGN